MDAVFFALAADRPDREIDLIERERMRERVLDPRCRDQRLRIRCAQCPRLRQLLERSDRVGVEGLSGGELECLGDELNIDQSAGCEYRGSGDSGARGGSGQHVSGSGPV